MSYGTILYSPTDKLTVNVLGQLARAIHETIGNDGLIVDGPRLWRLVGINCCFCHFDGTLNAFLRPIEVFCKIVK